MGPATAVLLGFVLLTGLAIYLASRARHSLLYSQVTRTLHTSGQFAVRSIIFILTVLVVLSMVLGLDMLLGAFAAGVLWKVAIARAPEQDRKVIEGKIDAIAFGFLVPVFFIDTGIDFDLRALTASPAALALVPLFLLLLLIIRGLPSILAAPPKSSHADKRAIILFGATGLPIVVGVTGIGRDEGLISGGIASALVGAGMLSVLVFPPLALRQHQRRPSETPARHKESPQETGRGGNRGSAFTRPAGVGLRQVGAAVPPWAASVPQWKCRTTAAAATERISPELSAESAGREPGCWTLAREQDDQAQDPHQQSGAAGPEDGSHV
ncbi:cation:proton antiporter [Pseudarthrobacter sp. MDT1-22]